MCVSQNGAWNAPGVTGSFYLNLSIDKRFVVVVMRWITGISGFPDVVHRRGRLRKELGTEREAIAESARNPQLYPSHRIFWKMGIE